jgi:hypothetical protein
MYINARSIPQLMRDGFHWSPTDNILPELTVITMDDRTLDDELRNAGFRHTKSYVMTDNKDGQQWTGKIIVYARRPGTLSEAEFQLGLLTPKTIWKCEAWDWDGQTVYWYDRDKSLSPINTIYSGMRLPGCWPQPPETGVVPKWKRALRRVGITVFVWVAFVSLVVGGGILMAYLNPANIRRHCSRSKACVHSEHRVQWDTEVNIGGRKFVLLETAQCVAKQGGLPQAAGVPAKIQEPKIEPAGVPKQGDIHQPAGVPKIEYPFPA